ncbi:unnamed protein product [Cylicocyclus nassatus]|uniref:SCP domain-containing protein n=1 Tax=Cylicocyclus nassatus TaxID=53992 RepID=A0AA36M725_CYLNA|nr:unnamed protein product [Cylicocyclus nassatus]
MNYDSSESYDDNYEQESQHIDIMALISEVDPSVATKAEFPGPEDGESGETSMCEWGGIPNTLRMNMLDTHNTRRELLALGQFTDNKGVTLPAAAKMNYLEWNCTLEKEAYEFLKSCPTEGYQRPNGNLPAQNFYRGVITEAEPTFRDMNKKTVTEWWKKGRKVNGPGKDLYFLLEHNSTEIKSFTLMGWGSTTQIGCSIAKCDDNWVEACRYYPPGNESDEQMYTPGRACSQCASLGKICHNQKGLCK